MTKKIKYYDVRRDIENYPDAWCFLAWSKRGPGKTYSSLRYMVEENKKFVFLKRTMKDVDLICMNGKKKGVEYTTSPFKPLNRDFGWNIGIVKISDGFAGFYEQYPDGQAHGEPLGYIYALSAAKDIKGFDLSECEYMIFDEFIPKKTERISRAEGEQLLDIYMTVRRDRVQRGLPDLKLLCLANATNANNPTFHVFDVTDVAVQMDITGTEFVYQEDRGILLHFIPSDEYNVEEKKSGIEKAMEGTEWAEMAFGGHFAYDDFTSVGHVRMKGYRPICAYEYKRKYTYVYEKDGFYYFSTAKSGTKTIYHLNRENEQKKFWYDFVFRFREETIEDKVKFEKYTDYDLVVNYRKIFDIG